MIAQFDPARFAACLSLVVLVGCTAFIPESIHLDRTTSRISVIDHAVTLEPNQLGRATWRGHECVVELREYPVCLAHEVDHCFLGQYHAGLSDEGCY